MAVVEKKPETPTTSTPMRLGLAGLVGTAFVVGSFAVAFNLIPMATETLGLSPVLQGLIGLVALIALLIVGTRLLGGKQERPGLRAAIFTGVVFLLLWLLLSRWIGGIIEGSTYSGWLKDVSPNVGTILFAVLSLGLGYWLLRIFLRPTFEQKMIGFEGAGWFNANTYKPGQGTRVRRGTILGLLLLMGSGIWVMLHRGILERGDPDWRVNVPFTGKYAAEDLGDGATQLKDVPPEGIRILSVGAAKGELEENKTLSKESVLAVVEPLAKTKRMELDTLLRKLRDQHAELKKRLTTLPTNAQTDVKNELTILSRWILRLEEFESDLDKKDSSLIFVQRKIDRFITAESDTERERRKSDKVADQRRSLRDELNWIVGWGQKEPLPIGAEVYTRYVVRDVNDRLDPDYSRVVNKATLFQELSKPYRFEKGQVVTRDEFERAVEEIKKKDPPAAKSNEENARKDVPEARPMKGNVYYSSVMLLPGIRYTVPLLLLVLVIWLAWRIVNLPTFADFLIATESEMNKVSWTTRHRLFQDTIVVLVTMVLMATFLFAVDIAWGKLLSSKPIGVLKIKPPAEKKKESDLKW